MVFLVGDKAIPNQIQIERSLNYKDIKGSPTVKFDPNFIEIAVKVIDRKEFLFLERFSLRKPMLLE